MNTEAWDVFMTVSRDSGIVSAQCFEGPVRIVKCLVYVIFFCVTLVCCCVSKASLVMMTTAAGDVTKVRRRARRSDAGRVRETRFMEPSVCG